MVCPTDQVQKEVNFLSPSFYTKVKRFRKKNLNLQNIFHNEKIIENNLLRRKLHICYSFCIFKIQSRKFQLKMAKLASDEKFIYVLGFFLSLRNNTVHFFNAYDMTKISNYSINFFFFLGTVLVLKFDLFCKNQCPMKSTNFARSTQSLNNSKRKSMTTDLKSLALKRRKNKLGEISGKIFGQAFGQNLNQHIHNQCPLP